MELIILDYIYKHLTYDFLDPILRIISYSGNNGLIFIIISFLLLINKKTRKIGLYCFVALIIGALLTNVLLKPLIARIRPYEYRDIVLKILEPTDYSFPSGHTTAGFAVALVLLQEKLSYKTHKLYLYLLLYVIIMAYSRMYFYLHYPSDIIAGIIIGYIASISSVLIINHCYERGCRIRLK